MSARSVAPVLLLAACQLDNPEYVVVEGLNALEGHLSPSAAVVRTETIGAERARFTGWSLTQGAAGAVSSSAGASVFRTTPGGAASIDSATVLQGVSLGDEVFVADCPYRARFSLTDPVAGLVELAQVPFSATTACGGRFGPGAGPDRLISLDQTLSIATLHQIDPVALTDTTSELATVTPPPAELWIVLVYEASEGVVASVWGGVDGLWFADAAGLAVPATAIEGGAVGATAWVGSDGAVRVATSAGLYRWNAATAEAVLVEPVPASPTGTDWVQGAWSGGAWAEAGEPNPAAPELSVPTAMAVRFATDAGFQVFEPPLTPCCDPEACRGLGESYVIGGIDTPEGPLVAYDYWSWFGDDSQFIHKAIVRPVDDPCPSGG